MESVRFGVLSGVKWNTFSNVLAAVLRVLQVAILTRFLEKSDFGLMGIALLFNHFCEIFVLMGFGTVVMHEQKISKELFSSLYWTNILVGFLLTILVSLSSPIIAKFYDAPELIGVISLTCIMIFTNSIYSLHQTVQQKKMNFKFINVLKVITIITTFVLTILFAYEGMRVYSIVWSSIIGSIITAIVYLYIGFAREKNILFHLKIEEVKHALKIGGFQMGSSTMEFFSREMDSLIISSNFSMTFFGVYTLCKNLGLQIYHFFNPIITSVLTPAYAKIQDDIIRIKTTYVKSVDIIGIVNFYFYGLVACLSVPILGILYGESYMEYYLILMCLCIYYAQQSMGNPVGSLIIAMGRTDLGFYWTIFRIIFVSLYMYVFSYIGNIKLFVIMLALLPLFTQLPHWFILLRNLIPITLYETINMMIKPFVITIPLLSLLFGLMLIDNMYVCGFVGFVLFTLIYSFVNYWLRRNLTSEIIDTAKSVVRKK